MIQAVRASSLGALALLALSCTASPEGPAEGVISSERQSIIGGTATDIGDFPTVVMLFNQLDGSICTGTLVASNVVLTAGHCVDPDLVGASPQQIAANTLVIFDNVDPFVDQTSGFVVGATQAFKKSTFNVNNLGDNDIGVVFLDQSITDREPTPIDLDPRRNMLGEITTQVGFGISVAGNQASAGTEFQVGGRVVTDCAQFGASNAKLICFDQTDGKGQCNGDSGGPTFDQQGKLVGITSFGDQDCTFFGADTRPAAELDFLQEIGLVREDCGNNAEGNGVDDDGNGLVDCEDPVCENLNGCKRFGCTVQTPSSDSNSGAPVLLLFALALSGLVVARKYR
jgi:secreted trypsin-like serine protease